MGFCKRKSVDCECLTDHSTCNSDNCHKKLPDISKKWLEGSKIMEEKYLQMLKAIHAAIEEWNTRYSGILPRETKTVGYHIKLRLEHADRFERIDWLADNGYIIITPKDWWCDITDSYWESYALTKKGKNALREMVERG